MVYTVSPYLISLLSVNLNNIRVLVHETNIIISCHPHISIMFALDHEALQGIMYMRFCIIHYCSVVITHEQNCKTWQILKTQGSMTFIT